MRTVAFAIDQRQDFFLSLAFARLLRQHAPGRVRTHGLLLGGAVTPEYEPYVAEFDAVTLLDGYHPPNRLRHLPAVTRRALRYRRQAKALPLREGDAIVGYSFRAIVLNALAREWQGRVELVRVTRRNPEGIFVRRRPAASAYWNLWNRLLGFSTLRYRWTVDSNRHGVGDYRRDPYDREFLLTASPTAANELPWPLGILRADDSASGPPTILFLGERYPIVEGDDIDVFRERLSTTLREIRTAFPEHRLVFKPRSHLSLIGQDLTGYELGSEDQIVESLLLSDRSIDKVVSFKSTGSVVAALYGVDGYLLYPLLDLPSDFRTLLDEHFADPRDTVVLAANVGDLGARAVVPPRPPEEIAALSSPFLEALAG